MTTQSTSVRSIAAPALPTAPQKYQMIYHNQLNQIIRTFFNTVANAINADIVSESTIAISSVPVNNTLDLSKVSNLNVNVPQLTDNIFTIIFPSVADDGDLMTIRFQQAASTGPFTVGGWPVNVLLAGGTYTMSPGAGQYDLITFHYDLDIDSWLEQSRSQNM